jgi:hypothetical protein
MKLKTLLKEIGTKTQHEKGAKLYISESHWFQVAGNTSDIGQSVLWDIIRLDCSDVSSIKEMAKIYARLVIDWSLDEELTADKVCEVFIEAPAVFDEVVKFYKDQSNFTKP